MKAIWTALLLTTVPIAPAAAQTAPATAEQLVDIENIRTLLYSYGRLLDDRRLAEYAQLFARQGEWVGGFGAYKTPAAIQAAMEKAFASFPSDPKSRNYHVITNPMIEVAGDRATAWSRWTFYLPGPDNKPSIMVAGRYEDELIREDGRWKFLKRVVVSDIPYMDPRETPAKAPR